MAGALLSGRMRSLLGDYYRNLITLAPDTVDGLPYVLTEAHLSGNPEKNQAIMKISPGKQGSNAAYNYVDELVSFSAPAVCASDETEGLGRGAGVATDHGSRCEP